MYFSGLIANDKNPFYVLATRGPYGSFYFQSSIIDNSSFPDINFIPDVNDLTNFQCITAEANVTSNKLDLFITDCFEQHTVICRKPLFVKPNCSQNLIFTNQSGMDILLDPNLKLMSHESILYKKAETLDMFKRLDKTTAYAAIFSTMWYSSAPCFEVRKTTGLSNGLTSLLRYCEWKGVPISCSAIFTLVPTDQGMCCSFNMKVANEIYVESRYRDALQTMQNADKLAAFLPSSIPTDYAETQEPKTISGINKGLVLIIDAHSNWIVPGSAKGDFHGFDAFIDSSSTFPLTEQAGVPIKSGFNNIIKLTSSMVVADDQLINLDKIERNCLFPEENSDLRIQKQYTFINCKFECALFYAQNQVFKKHSFVCQPWFFPTSNEAVEICDPWQTFDFLQIMSREIPDSICSHCLPDCNFTTYIPSIVVQPFETCDITNLGVSQFCILNSENPTIFRNKLINQIINQLPISRSNENNDQNNASLLISDVLVRYEAANILKKVPPTYDAFDRDIAMVQIIYQVSISSTFYEQIFV